MRTTRLGPCAAFLLLALAEAPVAAQATRTWVSGVGDDANPCSRTAPCKTFAGAISKTAAGGEISALDPAGFGAVTITKSIVINGTGTLAGILAAATNGIVVNAGENDVVTLRGIQIVGDANALSAIRFLGGRELRVERCDITYFARGVEAAVSKPARLVVKDTTISRISGDAITVGLTAPAKPLRVSLEGLSVSAAGVALHAKDGSSVTLRRCVLTGNETGVLAEGTSTVAVESSELSQSTVGLQTVSPQSSVYLSDSLLTANGSGIVVTAGSVVSFGNNRIEGNGSDGAPTSTVPLR